MISSLWRRLAVVLLVGVAFLPWGIKPTAAKVISAGATRGEAFAIASYKSGPISISVTSASAKATTTTLVVASGKLIFSFQIPAADFTQTATTASLDTHADLKSYGSIKITWKKVVSSLPGVSNKCNPSTSTQTTVYFSDGVGTADLNLPCLGQVKLKFGGPVKTPSQASFPTIGAYSGTVASVFATVNKSSNVSVTFSHGTTGSKSDASGIAQITFTDKLPLESELQLFHASFPSDRMQIKDDLGTANVDLTKGPKPLKGSKLNWTGSGTAKAATTFSLTDCKQKPGIGATRTAAVQGTLALQLCTVTGSFTLSGPQSLGQVYSSSVKGQQVTAPAVVSIVPADGATKVPTTLQTIVVTFNNAMSAQQAQVILTASTPEPDAQLLGNPKLDASGKVMTFTLQAPLKANTTYSASVVATDTNQTAVSKSIKFTTGP